ncbi:hypothetical protein GCM10011316_39150 [Roseibium aquae]|uniref:Uncharacterized protein n=1 Tax=Roseibium aquae TaxID=1323746 RepID=A0A916TPV0_9HYPH|nr:hypothetical protein [Roseibium aquae]GGB63461.1 hypothetical protein GCM10011316_39150 [Roseibium aquae]
MKDVLRFSDTLTWMEYRIATLDEIDLEEILWSQEQHALDDDLTRRVLAADRAALREIERLKLCGEYDAKRSRLAKCIDPDPPEITERFRRIKNGELQPVENFLAGLRSADPQQRSQFKQLYEKGGFANKHYREISHILTCLKSAHKPKGRPGATPPWRNVVDALDEMRVAVADGLSIPQAARAAAENEALAGTDNRARYFERLFRQRAKLRE